MTIHASKGLQFPIVHIPQLTARHFPSPRKDQYTLPPALLNNDLLMTREAEEDALFFVALSRARDELHLSRAIDNGGSSWKNCAPSPFLGRIARCIVGGGHATASWTTEKSVPTAPIEALPSPPSRDSWPAQAIETYLECPRKFYYGEVLHLRPRDGRTAFLKTHSALRSSIEWLQQTASPDERASGMAQQFSAAWAEKGPQGHALEALYQQAAQQMLQTAAALMQGKVLPLDLSLSVEGGVTVTVRADHITSSRGKVVIQRFKQGRLAKSGERPKMRYFVLQAAARRQYGAAAVEFEHVSLLTADRSSKNSTDKALVKEIAKLEAALRGIAAGHYPPDPNDYCATCPFYFICPVHFRVGAGGG